MEKAKLQNGMATPEQIEAWKKEHGKVFCYKADGKTGYLRTVDRDLFARAATKVNTNPAKFNELVIEGVWLGGDEELKNTDSYYFGLIEFVEQLLNKRKGEIEEL